MMIIIYRFPVFYSNDKQFKQPNQEYPIFVLFFKPKNTIDLRNLFQKLTLNFPALKNYI